MNLSSMKVVLEFGGGAELLVGNKRSHCVELKSEAKTLGHLLQWILENLLQQRPELFLRDPKAEKLDVRPGILVLVNDADWELVGETSYPLLDGDKITFISTLHGG